MSRRLRDSDDLSMNRLLASLGPDSLDLLKPWFLVAALPHRRILFEPGDQVDTTYFPCHKTIVSLVIVMSDGRAVEAATIGHEGAVGGIISSGHKPAFGRAIVQIPGAAYSIPTHRLEGAKQRSPRIGDIFSRYSDLLAAQLMQSAACNALHSIEQRCSRWLLATHDRAGSGVLHLTQESLAEMLGVQRTSVTAVARRLSAKGIIKYARGKIEILDRAALEADACECYEAVEGHFKAVLLPPP
jgi:CRP-like cAMP-binding protein